MNNIKSTVKLRLWLLGLAGGLILTTIAWAAVKSMEQISHLETQFTNVQNESVRIANHFRTVLDELNSALLRFEYEPSQENLQQFLQGCRRLHFWLDEQRPMLSTGPERDLLRQVDFYYRQYLIASNKLIQERGTAFQNGILVVRFKGVKDTSRALLSLGNQLANAHQKAIVLLESGSRKSLLFLRSLVLGCLGILVCLAGWGAYFVYQNMISPLRTQLTESRAIIERQEKLASLGLLASGIAHEVRSPLTAIKVRLFSLRKKLCIDEDVEVIDGEISRVENIVKEFLKFARPVEPNFEAVDARQLFSEIRDLFETLLAERSIRLLIHPGEVPPFPGDPQQLKQVLINLVQNAADSIAGGGSIMLSAQQGRRHLKGGEQPAIVLSVEDTGAGIPLEVQKRLFDPFFTTKEKGTGLGLCISAGIVDKHGGVLEFQTKPNVGTTFGIVLPFVPQAVEVP